MVTGFYQTYCGDHFAVYADTKPLYYMPETMSVIFQLKKLRTAVTTIYWFHVNVGFHSLIQMLGSEMAVL